VNVPRTLDALAGSAEHIRLLISRVGDDAFEVQLVIITKLLKAPTFDLVQMREAIRWARDRDAPVAFAFARWRGWAALGAERRAHEVLRVCEGAPLRVAVHVAAGGADMRLDMELPGDVRVEQMIEMTYTKADVHAQIASDYEKHGRALAATLGITCDVIS